MREQGGEESVGPSTERRRSWKRFRRLWGLLGVIAFALGVVALALPGANVTSPPRAHIEDQSNYLYGFDAPVSVCAMHYTPGPTPGSAPGTGGGTGYGGTCSQNDVVL